MTRAEYWINANITRDRILIQLLIMALALLLAWLLPKPKWLEIAMLYGFPLLLIGTMILIGRQ